MHNIEIKMNYKKKEVCKKNYSSIFVATVTNLTLFMETILVKFGVICRRLMSLGDIKFGENRFSVNHTLFCAEDKNLPILLSFRFYSWTQFVNLKIS